MRSEISEAKDSVFTGSYVNNKLVGKNELAILSDLEDYGKVDMLEKTNGMGYQLKVVKE